MDAEVIQTKYEELDAIARRFAQQAQANRTLHQRVQRDVGALRSGGWEGRGSAAFFAEMEQKVFPIMARLTEALAAAQATTLQVKAIIQQAEEEAASVFRGEYAYQPALPSATPTIDGIGAAGNRSGGTAAGPAIAQVAPYDYALMSQAAYANGGELPPALRDRGWKVLRGGETDTGYFGVAYVNDLTREVVIAHRGTNPDLSDVAEGLAVVNPMTGAMVRLSRPLARKIGINADGSDFDDDAMIAIGRAPDQYAESRPFVQSVQTQMEASGRADYLVTHTGHSLGGALADLHAAGAGQRAITFDNPGTQEILAHLRRSYDKTQHITYQSHPNLVNQTNTQAGYSISIKLNTDSKVFGVLPDLLHDHSLDNMVYAMDPRTGRPYRESTPIPH